MLTSGLNRTVSPRRRDSDQINQAGVLEIIQEYENVVFAKSPLGIVSTPRQKNSRLYEMPVRRWRNELGSAEGSGDVG